MLYDLNPPTWELNTPPDAIPTHARVVVVRGQDVLSTETEHWQPPQLTDMALAEEPIWLGYVDARPYYAAHWPDDAPTPPGHSWVSLRDLLLMSEQAFAVASRAAQLVTWLRQHQYCGQCGKPTRRAYEEHYLACDPCRLRFYPRIHPCIIVLVTRGDQVLLAQGIRQQKSGYYSTLAGFMEAGESVEQAVHREVFEEVGVRITNLRYINSQTWPFPNQLMLGFLAEYASGELTLDPNEIVDARWWPLDNLPKRPPSGSISGYLVDTYKRERGYL